ncbi:MAG: hypothetical protein AB8B61_03195 [Cyclobacteriaceae bacterium]
MAKTSSKYEELFYQEAALLKKTEHFLDTDNGLDNNKTQSELISIFKSYKDLLNQQILITKVSDRLQKKLDKSNFVLEEKNNELEKYIAELKKARIGRKATTIAAIISITLFIITEGFIEPRIDAYYPTQDYGSKSTWYSLGLKAVVALLFKPIESIVERSLLRKAKKKHLEAMENI